MSNQIWLQCGKHDVQKLKTWLGDNLSRADKVKKSDAEALILIPTTWKESDACLGSLTYPPEIETQHIKLISIPQEDGVKKSQWTIESGVSEWLRTLPAYLFGNLEGGFDRLVFECPKRWSIYHPMVLLPSESFASQAWLSLLTSIDSDQKDKFWQSILRGIHSLSGGGSLTHLAVNSGIPLAQTLDDKLENILRSPSGLIMLCGDFGPEIHPDAVPTREDFDAAFWVSTKQNGIYQTWAPRYTMFSRGNIKEKSRILHFHNRSDTFPGTQRQKLDTQASAAVDLYAGIGYFVFSYAALGISKVFCWEINPWSVEGLRRGAVENRWKVKIIRGLDLQLPAAVSLTGDEKIIVFEESNEQAGSRLAAEGGQELLSSLAVRHVNCGLLPTSEPSWRSALRAVDVHQGGWLHLHENVAVGEVGVRRAEIEKMIRNWAMDIQGGPARGIGVKVEHVELVKTFAPGVWHCVFDVYIDGRSSVLSTN